MSRFHRMLNLLALFAMAAPVLGVEDPKTLKELRELRALVEKQSQQIEALAQHVAKLSQTLDAKPILPTAPVQTPAASPAGSAPGGEFAADVPKAEAADGKRHIVVKGETLTSIAKHYNMPLAELQKANKEVDERKLQIGQTLTIPSPKTPETTPEKRDNP